MATAILEIHDEINVKISGLDMNDRKFLNNKYKFEVPGARYLPAVRLGRWDGKMSFFSMSAQTYINILDEIIPILYDRGYDIEINDTRTYNRDFSFDAVDETTFAHKTWPTTHQLAGQPIVLRDYQIEIVNTLLTNLGSITVAATGSGKTIVVAALSYRCEQYGRTIIIVPNKTLVSQTEEDYINLGLDVGVYYGDRKDYGHMHTICTWQSLNIILKNTKSGDGDFTIQEFLDGVVCVMADECFDGNSNVLTTTGYIPIKNIKAGDLIINYSEDTKVFKTDTVVKLHTNLTNSTSEKMYEMEFDNGNKIQVTGNHKFLTSIGWIRADELTEDHIINTYS